MLSFICRITRRKIKTRRIMVLPVDICFTRTMIVSQKRRIIFMKKTLAIILCMVLLCSSVMSGCSKKASDPKGAENSKVSDSGKETEKESSKESSQEALTELTLPLTNEKETLTVWCIWSSDYIDSPNDTPGAKKMEELTNVHINYVTVARNDAAQKFSMMLASGEYPDIIQDVSYPGGGDKAIEDDVYTEITELVNNYMPNYKKLINSDTLAKKMTTTDTGKVYGVYRLYTNTDAQLEAEPPYTGMAVRKDWLEDCGLEIPVTISDWEVMLTAFKEKKKVEAPLMLGADGTLEDSYFLSAYGTLSEFYQDNGTVKYGPVEAGYKQYVELLRSWYGKGLIDPNFISNDSRMYGVMDYSATGKTGAWKAHFIGTADWFYQSGRSDDPRHYVIGVSAPVLNKGEVAQSRHPNYVVGEAYAISTQCKNKELAAKWLDYQYTTDGIKLNYYGVEGETYNVDADGKLSYSEFVTNNPNGYSPVDAHFMVGRGESVGAFDYTKEYLVQSKSNFDAGKVWEKDGNSLILPPLTLTSDEGAQYSAIYADIKTFVQENTVKFIMGTKPMEEYDAFVEAIKALNIEKCIEIQQTALERYHSR